MVFAAERLFPELWLLVFEDVARHGYAGAVVRLMLVCKAWKVVATPLAYQYVKFSETRNVRTFLFHLVSCDLANRFPGDYTWTLRIDIRDSSWDAMGEHAMADIPGVLRYLPNLQSFSLLSTIIPSVLGLLLRTSKQGLRELSIHLRDESKQLSMSLDVLSQLRELQQLSVTLPTSRNNGGFQIDPSISLNMPGVRRLRWGVWESAAPSFLALLSRSWFPVLDHLELECRTFGEPFPELSPNMERFLTTHGQQLVRLDLEINHYDHIPISLCPHLRTIGFHVDMPSSSFLQQLPITVESVYLHLPEWYGDDDDWSSLDPIVLHASSRSAIAVHFVVMDNPQFAWTNRGGLPPEYMGQLLGKALQLAEKGVRVFDPRGNLLQINSHLRLGHRPSTDLASVSERA